MIPCSDAALHRRPYVINSVSSATLFGAGDILAQQGIEKVGSKHDFLRTLRISVYGGFVFSPIMTRWYSFLQTVNLRSKWSTIGARVGLDQFVLTPNVVAIFFTSMAVLEGKDATHIKQKLYAHWQPTLIRNWAVFIPVQLLNFAVVPPQLRLLVVNCVSLFWNCYLSFANSH